jgi:hypothetical protein
MSPADTAAIRSPSRMTVLAETAGCSPSRRLQFVKIRRPTAVSFVRLSEDQDDIDHQVDLQLPIQHRPGWAMKQLATKALIEARNLRTCGVPPGT